MERARLLYHELHKNEIKRGLEWLKKLKVIEIDQIEASYTLKIYGTKRKSITACIKKESNNSWILYVTPNSEFLEISQHLVRNIYRSNKPKDVFNLSMLLSSPLSHLAKIYPVDCIPDLPNLQNTVECIPNLPNTQRTFECTPNLPNLHTFGMPKLPNLQRSVDRVPNLFNLQRTIECTPNLSNLQHTFERDGQQRNFLTRPATTATFKNIQNDLRDAINSCCSSPGSVINSQTSVQNVPSYCKVIPGMSNICLI